MSSQRHLYAFFCASCDKTRPPSGAFRPLTCGYFHDHDGMKICVRTLILCCTYYLEFGVFRTIPLALFLHSALARAIVDFLSVFQDSAIPVFGYSMLCGRFPVLSYSFRFHDARVPSSLSFTVTIAEDGVFHFRLY